MSCNSRQIGIKQQKEEVDGKLGETKRPGVRSTAGHDGARLELQLLESRDRTLGSIKLYFKKQKQRTYAREELVHLELCPERLFGISDSGSQNCMCVLPSRDIH